MNYDANVFKAKANIKARRIWLFLLMQLMESIQKAAT